MEGDRMIKNKCVVASIFIVVLFVTILLSCSSNNTGVAPIQNSGKYYGYIYNQNGSPAKGARISIVPADYVPKQGLAKKTATDPVIVTDENGRFTIDNISSGTYNLFGEGNGVASYASSVIINEAAKASLIAVDTLKVPGSIFGYTQIAPQGDSRKILILAIGSNLLTTPLDSSLGYFGLGNLAPGNYRLRFLTMDPQYPVFDTTVTVESGKSTNMRYIILSNATGLKVQQIVIMNNEIFGWNLQTKGSFSPEVYPASHFDNMSSERGYITQGLIDAVMEDLSFGSIITLIPIPSGDTAMDSSGQFHVTTNVMDYGTDTNALRMYQYRQMHSNNPILIPGYDNTVAEMDTTLGEPTACAHFNKFFIELQFDGQYYYPSDAIPDAKLFLDLIKSKIQ